MGFIRFRFILLGRKLILKLEGSFLEEKMDCTKSRPGRVQILSDPVLVIGILFHGSRGELHDLASILITAISLEFKKVFE